MFKLSWWFPFLLKLVESSNVTFQHYRWSPMGQCCQQTGLMWVQRRWKPLHLTVWSWRNGSINAKHLRSQWQRDLIFLFEHQFCFLSAFVYHLFFKFSIRFYLSRLWQRALVQIEVISLNFKAHWIRVG